MVAGLTGRRAGAPRRDTDPTTRPVLETVARERELRYAVAVRSLVVLATFAVPLAAASAVTSGCSDDDADAAVGGSGGITWSTSSNGGLGGGAAGPAGPGAGGQGGAGSGGGPTVASVSPADGTTAVPADTAVTVTFSGPMAPDTATASTTTACSGSLQLSLDGFGTCVPMAGNPTTSDDVTFTLTPASELGSAGTFQLRATTDLTGASGSPLAAPFESAGFTVRYGHTIVIDGINDFATTDELESSTIGARLFVSFDETHLYLGLEHVDIAVSGGGNKWVYFLLSTDPTLATGTAGSSDGLAVFGTASKMMFHYKERIAGGSFSEYRVADGTDWDTDWGTAGKSSYRADGYLEASIALSELGANVTDVLITTYTVDYAGASGDGYLYNMLPAATAGPGDPARDLVQYVHLELPTSLPPNHAGALGSF